MILIRIAALDFTQSLFETFEIESRLFNFG